MLEIPVTNEPLAPLELQPVPPGEVEPVQYPAWFADQIVVDVIHDGRSIPEDFLFDRQGRRVDEDILQKAYVRERDWGASIVAARLAARLGLPGFYKVNTARCLLEFGRFPGTTPKDATHLRRFAINHPFSELLGFQQKKRLLEQYFDEISRGMDAALEGRLIKIAVHTYDKHNPSGTVRPQVSMVSRTLGYQMESHMPYGVFDPLFPDILAEFTVDRILRDRISLTLEKAGIPVAHNYPYLLPEGSPEVRHQVHAFFQFLRRRFEEQFPSTAGRSEYVLVWNMLHDTNLRSAEAVTLRSHLHMYRRPPPGRVREFARAEAAYRHIEEFLGRRDGVLTEQYTFLDDRPSSLGIEVRKDLVWEFDAAGMPIRPTYQRAWYIADTLAEAIGVYLREDRPHRAPPVRSTEPFTRSNAWYSGLDTRSVS